MLLKLYFYLLLSLDSQHFLHSLQNLINPGKVGAIAGFTTIFPRIPVYLPKSCKSLKEFVDFQHSIKWEDKIINIEIIRLNAASPFYQLAISN